MRSALLLSAAMLAFGIVGSTNVAHAQASSPTDRQNFNTSGPGQSNQTTPTARPGSVGRPPHAARHNPGDSAKSSGIATSRSLDPMDRNTAGPGQTSGTSNTHEPVVNRPVTGPQVTAAGRPGNGSQPYAPGTTATQSGPGYNTSGNAAANQSNPAAPTH